MAATLTAPGLQLQRAEAPPPPLRSAITGFVGIAERGPLHSPQPLLGWSDYVDTFGEFVPFGSLAESVFGFFRNGGEKCWVVRAADTSRLMVVTPAGQCPRELPLATASRDLTDHTGAPSLRVRALDPGDWGNRLRFRVGTSTVRPIRVGVLTVGATPADAQLELDAVVDLRPGITIRIAGPDGTSGALDRRIAAAPASVDLGTRRVTLAAPVGAAFPAGSVVYAAGLRLEAEFRGRREAFDPVSMRDGHPRDILRVVNAPDAMSDYAERRRRGFSSLIRVERLPAGGASRFRPSDTVATELSGGSDGFTQATGTFRDPGGSELVTLTARAARGSDGNGLRVVAVPFGSSLALPVPDATGARDRIAVTDVLGFRAGEALQVIDPAGVATEGATPDAVDATAMRLGFPANLANAHAAGEAVTVTGRFTLEVRRGEAREPIETIRNLSGDPAAGPRYIRTVLASAAAAGSGQLCAAVPPAPFATPIPVGARSAQVTLRGGADPGEIDARYYTGYEDDGRPFAAPGTAAGTLVGLAALERVEEIDLVAVPDVIRVAAAALPAAQTNILRHCRQQGDRFALLDAPAELGPRGATEFSAALPGRRTEDWVAAIGTPELRRYGAAYHPRVWCAIPGGRTLMPPSGLVAGIIARTDAARGATTAPANAELRGAFGTEPEVDRARHGELNPVGVNCVVKLEEGDFRLMGARTLSEELVHRYVNVRRTVLGVRKLLAQRMLWAVFEPVSDALFARLTGTLDGMLRALLAGGAMAADRAADAYYVRCDRTNNPPAQWRDGIVVAEVGLALRAPAEFIVITARRTPDAVQVIEEEA